MRTMAERFYTDEEAQEILRMAARTSIGSGAVSHRELLETAAELGIRPEEVLQAENAFLEQQALESDRKEFRKHKRKELFGGVSRWISLAILLYGIALVTNGFEFKGLLEEWPKWPVGIIGLFVIKDLIEASVELTFNREAAFEKWRAKHSKGRATNIEGVLEPLAAPVTIKSEVELQASALEQNQARS